MANNVQHVAKYILELAKTELSTWKLQKLVYYSQAWHLVWQDKLLFPESIQAWANGPVVPALYQYHRGTFSISVAQFSYGDSSKLTAAEKETIGKVYNFYKDYNGQQLSDITHAEKPWQDARQGLGVTERGAKEIKLESMAEFYSSLPAK